MLRRRRLLLVLLLLHLVLAVSASLRAARRPFAPAFPAGSGLRSSGFLHPSRPAAPCPPCRRTAHPAHWPRFRRGRLSPRCACRGELRPVAAPPACAGSAPRGVRFSSGLCGACLAGPPPRAGAPRLCRGAGAPLRGRGRLVARFPPALCSARRSLHRLFSPPAGPFAFPDSARVAALAGSSPLAQKVLLRLPGEQATGRICPGGLKDTTVLPWARPRAALAPT